MLQNVIVAYQKLFDSPSLFLLQFVFAFAVSGAENNDEAVSILISLCLDLTGTLNINNKQSVSLFVFRELLTFFESLKPTCVPASFVINRLLCEHMPASFVEITSARAELKRTGVDVTDFCSRHMETNHLLFGSKLLRVDKLFCAGLTTAICEKLVDENAFDNEMELQLLVQAQVDGKLN